jgi:hypothetical protein
MTWTVVAMDYLDADFAHYINPGTLDEISLIHNEFQGNSVGSFVCLQY